jgi:hypothetical protein
MLYLSSDFIVKKNRCQTSGDFLHTVLKSITKTLSLRRLEKPQGKGGFFQEEIAQRQGFPCVLMGSVAIFPVFARGPWQRAPVWKTTLASLLQLLKSATAIATGSK